MLHDLRAHQQATVAAAEGELDGSDHEGGTLGIPRRIRSRRGNVPTQPIVPQAGA
jgi:hypothetical protein